ncbi:MAG: dipeptidase [Bacteroidota bacterium]|nr:dipeptidase [Bacteroidota bacterium]
MKKLIVLSLIGVLITNCKTYDEQLIRRAAKIHEKILTVDTHCDTPMDMVRSGFELGVRHNEGCVDFPRMKEGGLSAEFFAVFTSQGPRNDSAFEAVHELAVKTIKTIIDDVDKNSAVAGIAYSPDDAYRLKKAGKIAAFIGIENGYPVGKDLTRVREFYDSGARYITLCHSKNNDICDSSTDSNGPENDGLSAFGRDMVREMNRLGMMIDVSHISDKSFYDVIQLSKAPVIASHSSCRALCGSPRNLTDDMLIALKNNGGAIQICILSEYIKTPDPNPELEAKMKELRSKYDDPEKLSDDKRKEMRAAFRELRSKYQKLATVRDVVDHIDHVVQVAGIDHVGIGTDFDGGGGVTGCMTVADMKNITVELLRRGYSTNDIEKIWGGNIMRVFREVQAKRES